MNTYCHSDVNLLQKGMEKLREKFLMLTKVDGTPILVDPFNYMTIAGVAFAGIFVHTFYPKTPLSLFHVHQMRIIRSKFGKKAMHLPSGKCWKWMVLWSNKYRVPVWWLFLSQVSFLLQSCRSSTSSCEDEERKNQKKVQLPIKLCKMYVNTEVNTNK